MSSAIFRTLSIVPVLMVAALANPARADVLLFQTATVDPGALANDVTLVLQGDGTTQGNGFSGGSIMIGADFIVTAPTVISSIGASFADTTLTAGSGSIFGAIVTVDPVTGLPTQPVETLSNITLGYSVFTPSSDGDTTTALSLALQPGTYGLVFGSGLFGATGVADLLHGEDPAGMPLIFSNTFAPFAIDQSNIDVRLFVNAVPEPASIAVLAVGGLALSGLRRRRG